MKARQGKGRVVFVRRIRLLLVYSTLTRILLSYASLYILGFILGKKWRNNAAPGYHRKSARHVQRTILKLKGLFIKLGQLISILTNFLPESFRTELEELQDRIPPRPYDQIVSRIREEFGSEPAQLFKEFNTEPVASASLAQVHQATLHDGRVVAVKVQHLDIEETAQLDLAALYRVFSIVGSLFKIRGLKGQFEQISTMIHEELDFTKEADYIKRISANFEGNEGIGFPEIVEEFSTKRVLTTVFIDGIKATNTDALNALNIDREQLAIRIVDTYCQMIFQDGIYHADPHPGNLFIRPDGRIVFIDFGAVAQLSAAMKEGIPQFLISILRRDPDMVLTAIKKMGFISHHQDEQTAIDLIDLFHERFLEQLPIDSLNLGDLNAESAFDMHVEAWGDLQELDISLRDLMSAFQVPKDWILLERTVLLLMGLCTHLYPQLNPMQTIRPYLEETVLGPDRDWRQFLSNAVRDMARSAISIPDEMRRLLVRANQGELEVQIPELKKSTSTLYALGQQFLFGFLALGSGVLAFLGRLYQDPPFFYTASSFAAFFLFCMLFTIFRRK